MSLERLWAGWRNEYVSHPDTGRADNGCVFCNLIAATDDREALVLERTPQTIIVMNLYPYGSGHLMVAPIAHVPTFEDLPNLPYTEQVRAGRSAPYNRRRNWSTSSLRAPEPRRTSTSFRDGTATPTS